MKKLFLLFLMSYTGLCHAQTSQAVFEKQILELLKYSDNEFKDIKGEIIQGSDDQFESTFKLGGAVKNIIWEMGLKYFIATFPETEDSNEASIAFMKMEESIKKVLGDKATATTSEEEKELIKDLYQKTKTIKYRKHNGESTAYYVLLELKKTTGNRYYLAEKVKYSKWTITLTIYQDLEF